MSKISILPIRFSVAWLLPDPSSHSKVMVWQNMSTLQSNLLPSSLVGLTSLLTFLSCPYFTVTHEVGKLWLQILVLVCSNHFAWFVCHGKLRFEQARKGRRECMSLPDALNCQTMAWPWCLVKSLYGYTRKKGYHDRADWERLSW